MYLSITWAVVVWQGLRVAAFGVRHGPAFHWRTADYGDLQPHRIRNDRASRLLSSSSEQNSDEESIDSSLSPSNGSESGRSSSRRPPKRLSPSTFRTALGIVPPDHIWDTIQRARFVGEDKSYTQWPPCLRLFHPFGSDVDPLAFHVADCIDNLQIESFEIRLSEWSIIPHAEVMELQWWRTAAREEEEVDESQLSTEKLQQRRDEQEIQELIAREEDVGRKKLVERLRKQGQDVTEEDLLAKAAKDDKTSDPSYLEFDGPCVLCLEPDAESREDLLTLRTALQKYGLATYSPFAPTATVDPSIPPVARYADFRPIIPIASFATVSAAIPVATRFRSIWDPLTWEVTDLQILTSSELESPGEGVAESEDDPVANWRPTRKKSVDSPGVMGCSAMIMLHGEEMEMDDNLNEEVANLVAQKGEDGGFVKRQVSYTESTEEPKGSPSSWSVESEDLSQRNGAIDDIEAYLAEDDEADYDEGTVVIIGRTHFFTGDMRIYEGMPAVATGLYDAPKKKKAVSSPDEEKSG